MKCIAAVWINSPCSIRNRKNRKNSSHRLTDGEIVQCRGGGRQDDMSSSHEILKIEDEKSYRRKGQLGAFKFNTKRMKRNE